MSYINTSNIPHCNECGGSVNHELQCEYCGNKKHPFIELISPETDIEKFYINIYIKLLSGNITKDEEKKFLEFIKLNMIEEKNFSDTVILMDRLLNKKLNISFETFREIFKFSMIKGLREVNNGKIEKFNPRCEIIKLENENGYCNGYDINKIVVAIDEELLENFYKTGDINLLITMYHELHHVIQNINKKAGSFSENLLTQIKEDIIREYEIKKYGTNTYYENNYFNINSEADARYMAVNYVIKLLAKFNVKLNDFTLNDLINNYIGKPDLINRKIIKNEEERYSTINEIFDTIIKEVPEYLEIYPQLKVEYINDNGVIRQKNEDELYQTMANTIGQIELQNITDYITKLLKSKNFKQK